MSEESIGEYREGYDAGWNECAKLFKDNGLALGAKDAELATLRKQLATAEADCAAMRETLEDTRADVASGWMPDLKDIDAALTRPTGQAIMDRLAFAEQACEELLKCGSWGNSFDEIVKFETSEGARHFGNASTRAIAWAHLIDAARKANT